jgi:hypothetical protein
MSMEGFVSDFFPFLLTKLYFVQDKLLIVIVCSFTKRSAIIVLTHIIHGYANETHKYVPG